MHFEITGGKPALSALAGKFGLNTPLNIILDAQSRQVAQIVSWAFRPQAAFFTPKEENSGSWIVVFLNRHPRYFYLFGENQELRMTLKGKKWLAQILAHEIRHQIEFQSRAGLPTKKTWLRPQMINELPPPTLWQFCKSLPWRIVYFLQPYEIRARWHSFRYWRQYYQACWGRSYFDDYCQYRFYLRFYDPATLSKETLVGMLCYTIADLESPG